MKYFSLKLFQSDKQNQPVSVVEETGTVVFDWVGQKVPLVDKEEAEVDDPEESFEQGHVHVVIVAIVHEAAVAIFYQDKPGTLYFSF